MRQSSDQKPVTRKAQPGSRKAQPGSRKAEPGSRTAQPGTRKAQPETRKAQPETRNIKPKNAPILQMVAKTFYGLEDMLVEELVGLGAQHVTRLNRAVSFEGDRRLLYEVNYASRLALKILVHLKQEQVRDEQELYACIRSIRWDRYLDIKDTFAIEAVLKSTSFSHSRYVEQKIKDAIADQFRERFNQRPSVDLADPDLKIHAHITNKTLRLSLDSSGQPLFKRGYRTGQGAAPLNEVLAAGLIRLSGWTGDVPFLDLMCGSGTLPIEAAMMVLGIAPGSIGRKYGFQHWREYEPSLFNEVVEEHRKKQLQNGRILTRDKIRIEASDISPVYTGSARRNARQAGVEKYIRFSSGHFSDFRNAHETGLVMVNPPYGERLKQENLNELYSQLGNKLKTDFNGHEAWIFSGNKEAMKHVGLRTAARYTLYNGPLECKFHRYLMYEGSKKLK